MGGRWRVAAMVGLGCWVGATPVRAAPPSAAPVAEPSSWQGCDAQCRDHVRVQIAKDDALRKRWRRGNVLLGVGVPVAAGGAVMLVGGGLLWTVIGPGQHDPNVDDPPTPVVLMTVGAVAVGGAVAMIVLGALDRKAVKREARRRLSLSLAPSRRGALLGATMRF